MPCTISQCTECMGDPFTCKTCDDGYLLLNDTCISCPQNCQNCSEEYNCSTCNSGYYSANGVCQSCTEGCAICDSTECFNCSEGYKRDSLLPHDCSLCSDNCFNCTDFDICLACIDGMYLKNGSCYSCDEIQYCHQCRYVFMS